MPWLDPCAPNQGTEKLNTTADEVLQFALSGAALSALPFVDHVARTVDPHHSVDAGHRAGLAGQSVGRLDPAARSAGPTGPVGCPDPVVRSAGRDGFDSDHLGPAVQTVGLTGLAVGRPGQAGSFPAGDVLLVHAERSCPIVVDRSRLVLDHPAVFFDRLP